MTQDLINTVYTKIGNIGIVEINNPPANYLTSPEFLIIKELNDYIKINALKGIVITGKGRHFCAGASMDSLQSLSNIQNSESIIKKGKDLLNAIENLSIPVVAAIRGVCYGGGLEIALACHIRVCSENTHFSFPETGLGLIPGLGGTIRFPLIIGKSEALKVILDNSIISASEAKAMKLVDYISPNKDVVDFSVQLLNRLTQSKSQEVIQAVVSSINNAFSLNFANALEEETKLFCSLASKASLYKNE